MTVIRSDLPSKPMPMAMQNFGTSSHPFDPDVLDRLTMVGEGDLKAAIRHLVNGGVGEFAVAPIG